MFPINFNSSFIDTITSFPRIVKEWFGHLWSICTTKIKALVDKISSVANERVFSKEVSLQEETLNDEPLDVSIDVSIIDSKAEGEESLVKNDLTEKSDMIKPAEEIDLSPSPLTAIDLNIEIKTESGDSQEVIEEDKLSDDELEGLSDMLKEPDKENISSLTTGLQTSEPSPSVELTSSSQISIGRRAKGLENARIALGLSPTPPRRKIREDRSNFSPYKQNSSAKVPFTQTKPTTPTQNGPLIIDCGGGGDCQLLSLLRGLDMQYSDLSFYEKDSKKIPYTDLDLRKKGIEFARTQIETSGEYAETIKAYIDLDRKEYNEGEVASLKLQWTIEKEKLQKKLKDTKMTQEEYKKQLALKTKEFEPFIEDLDTNIVIKTEEDFLDRLEKKGFSCATLHPFALSAEFNLPIHVHEKNGIPGHDIQIFNPTESILNPIHLLRVRKGHYQLMIYPS